MSAKNKNVKNFNKVRRPTNVLSDQGNSLERNISYKKGMNQTLECQFKAAPVQMFSSSSIYEEEE